MCGGQLMSLMCSSPVGNKETPYQRNSDACQTILNRLRPFGRRVRQSIIIRMCACTDSGELDFRHLL
jgi:hypothetical protein